jgi:hypothetical protein
MGLRAERDLGESVAYGPRSYCPLRGVVTGVDICHNGYRQALFRIALKDRLKSGDSTTVVLELVTEAFAENDCVAVVHSVIDRSG